MTGTAGALALLLSVGLLCVRRIDTAVLLCALQSLCAAAAMSGTVALVAAVSLLLSAIALPIALWRSDLASDAIAPGYGLVAWPMGLGVAAAIIWAGGGGVIASGVAVTLLGLVLAASRAHWLMPALGLLSSQNGLVLVATANTRLSLAAAVAVAVPLVPALVFADARLRR